MNPERPTIPEAAATGRRPRHRIDSALAHEVKRQRGVIKGLLAAGELSILDVLDHPAVQTMPLPDLLYTAANTETGQCRRDRADRVIERLDLRGHDRISELTVWQRSMLRIQLEWNGFRVPSDTAQNTASNGL